MKTNASLLSVLLLSISAGAAPVFVTGEAAVRSVADYQAKADRMKAAVLAAKSDFGSAKGTRYYVSSAGADDRDGRSEATALASLEAVGKLALKPGDAVLFRRGDMFRGQLTARSGVTYSAYGDGPKPVLCGSSRDWADPALWRATEISNVWLCAKPLKNVGVITFDHEPGNPLEIGRYDVLTARMVHSRKGVASPRQLGGDLQFWCDLEGKRLYLFSAKGNPGARFRHIEIGEGNSGIPLRGARDVTVDNLHLTLYGCHGVGSGTTVSLEVRNCVFDWIGGSLLIPEGRKGGPCRFGNAVEVYGGCDGYRVRDCWMYQIYDTGITHQCHHAKDGRIIQKNVEYARNLIEYCFWSIEYYNAFNGYGETRDVYVHHNFCRFGGYGWGCAGRAGGTPMFSIDDRPDVTSNYVNEANILERSLGILVNNFGRHAPEMAFRGNVYVQPRGWNFASIGDLNRNGKCFPFDESAADAMREAFGETDGTYVILPEEKRDLTAPSVPRPAPRPALLGRIRAGVEILGIVHWGLNTFTDREWGYGDEDPKLLDPDAFDADQIVRACRDGGIQGLVLVAKHHDGFCLWPTETTPHNISKSPFRGGRGDYVKEMAEACRRAGLRFGVYCSPWDRNNPDYATPKYVETFHAQIRELLSGRYGEIFEMWFDGANGGDGYYGGTREKRRIPAGYYRFDEVFAFVRTLQPEICIFNEADGADYRWPGNERGELSADSSATIRTYDPPNYGKYCNRGDLAWGTTFHPPECDFPLRKGWFYHASDTNTVRCGEFLMQRYLETVGNGGTINIGIAPDRHGRLAPEDVAALRRFGELKREFFAKPATDRYNVIVLTEDVAKGERVDSWKVSAADGRALASGSALGIRRIRVLPQAESVAGTVVTHTCFGGAKAAVGARFHYVEPRTLNRVMNATTTNGETDTAKWMTGRERAR